MTAIAATTGTIRSRVDGTLVLALEIDPGQAQEAFRLFGSPGTQVAIAALRDGSFLEQPPVEEPTPEPKTKIGDACLLACRWCADPQFWEWASDATHGGFSMCVSNPSEAKDFICHMVGVTSRRELDSEAWANELWHEVIRKPYRDYLIAKGQ